MSAEAAATSFIGSPKVIPITEGRRKTPATSTLVSTASVVGPPAFLRAAGISTSDGVKVQVLTDWIIRSVNVAVSRSALIAVTAPVGPTVTSSRTSPPPTSTDITDRVGMVPLLNRAGVSAPVVITAASATTSVILIFIGYGR
jgi:hypothetical protein